MKSEDEGDPKKSYEIHIKSYEIHILHGFSSSKKPQRCTKLLQHPEGRALTAQARRLHAAEGQWWVAAHEVVHEAHSGLEKERQPWG